MRHERFWIAGAALVLIATACGDASSITGPPAPDAARPDALTSHTSTQDVPFTVEEVNPCAPPTTPIETVTSEGTAHFVIGSTTDNTGGIHLSTEFTFRGTGMGAPSLLPYTLNEQQSTSEQEPGSAITWTEEWRVIVKPPKPELTYMRHIMFKWTMNATGIPTASFDRMYTKCGTETTHVEL
jgi:hypothetical protein